MFMRPARMDLSSQPCRDTPASKRASRWYSWRAERLRAIVLPVSPALFFASFFLGVAMPRIVADAAPWRGDGGPDDQPASPRPGAPFGRAHVPPRERGRGLSAPVRLVRGRPGAGALAR